jgi:Tol biopolymer transport system component
MSILSHRCGIVRGATALALAGLVSIPALGAPIQITTGAGFNSHAASVSDDGNRVAFYSASNLTGQNADNSFEIFLYDRPSHTITQVSDFGGGHLAGGNQVPVLSGDGNRLSYQHFTSGGGTAFFQTVFYDHLTKSSVTVTAPSNFGETNELSRDGKTIAVATGNTGLRLYDTAGGVLGPVIAGNTFNTAMSRDGSMLALELFGRLQVRDLAHNTTLDITPSGAGFNMRPDFSDDGRTLAFSSSYDPLGTNADRNAEIFVYDLDTHTVRQITFSTGDANSNAQVSLSADGKRLAFSSTANLLGGNADGNQEIYVYDLIDDLLTQVTQTSGPGVYNFEPSLSGDGLTLAFTSSADLVGQNPTHQPQVFLERLAPSNGVPEPGTALLLAAAALGAVVARRGGQRGGRG